MSLVPFRSGLSLWPAAACLISELAAELAALPVAELKACDVILPNHRLATWLVALLARTHPAFVPPRRFTLDGFIEQYADELDLGGTASLPLADMEQELLL